jgi:hypothetical protein
VFQDRLRQLGANVSDAYRIRPRFAFKKLDDLGSRPFVVHRILVLSVSVMKLAVRLKRGVPNWQRGAVKIASRQIFCVGVSAGRNVSFGNVGFGRLRCRRAQSKVSGF